MTVHTYSFAKALQENSCSGEDEKLCKIKSAYDLNNSNNKCDMFTCMCEATCAVMIKYVVNAGSLES